MSDANSKLPNLNTETEKFISMLENQDNPPLYKLSHREAWQFLEDIQRQFYSYDCDDKVDISDIVVSNLSSESIDVRIYRPKNVTDVLPVIVYIHGGGWVMGSKNSYDLIMKKLCYHTGCAVFFPEYSLSPQAVYPKALEEIRAVLDYVLEHEDELNIDSLKIVLAGDSVGANMATVTALQLKKEISKNTPNVPNPIFEVLFYPVTNIDMDTKSYNSFTEGPWLTKKAMEWFFKAYIPEKELKDEITVSPLKASEEELSLLPPTLVITAENDVLRDEGEAYARKLDSAGVDVTSVRFNGTIHDFLMLNALCDTPAAKGALELACNMIKNALV